MKTIIDGIIDSDVHEWFMLNYSGILRIYCNVSNLQVSVGYLLLKTSYCTFKLCSFLQIGKLFIFYAREKYAFIGLDL